MSEQEAADFFRAGVAHERAGRVSEARVAYERAVALAPGHLAALNNLGTLLGEAGEQAAAEDCYRRAIDANPQAAEPWINLGNNLTMQGRRVEAHEAFLCALVLQPSAREAHWNLALLDLANGNFQSGWDHYRFRPTADRTAPLPKLVDGTLKIVAEQGLGDQLFFLRFVPQLTAMGVRVGLAMDPRITAMIERALPEAAADARETLSVADLPYLLRAVDCPPSLTLTPLPARIATMRMRLAAGGPPPYVGLSWRAGERGLGALFKEVPARELGAALNGVHATFVSLQRAPDPEEHMTLGMPVLDLSAHNAELEDMLALMSLLDDYVGVSNTNMHLRAGVGRTARVLVANPPEYRWMAQGDSPWFPGFEVYRESHADGWTQALAQLRADMMR